VTVEDADRWREKMAKRYERREYNSIGFLTYLSAAWCGVAVTLIATIAICVTSLQIWKILIEYHGDVYDFAGQFFVLGVVGPFIILVLGIAFGRFLLRALPPKFSVQAHRGWLV
jgi:hypothetical protein